MEVKIVFVRSLSQKVKILKGTRQELTKELVGVASDVSELGYKSWILENFIPGINIVFENILIKADDKGTAEVQKLKDTLYKHVLTVNPLLTPEDLYIDSSNNITITKQDIKLIDLDTWKIKEDPSSLMVVDLHQYFDLSDQAREHDHYLETEYWELLDMGIKVRVFSKNLKNTLMFGVDPKTEDDVKFYVVAVCIDSFYHIYQYISNTIDVSHIPFSEIVYSLYDIAIAHNPFLDLKIKDIKRINKNLHQFRRGTKSGEEDVEVPTSARPRLDKVPKQEILNLENTIKSNIFGQKDAIESVCNAIKRAYLGLKLNKRPIGAFLFYGPTSTGKTELAKTLARELIKSETDGLVKIACNTLQTDHTLHTLIGAPPSYVGYDDKGLLFKSFKKSKFKILLFDEIDKATDKLFDLLLEILEEGKVLVADGTVLDLTEAIIIMTSNIGQQEANNALNTAGFEIEDNKDSERKKILEGQYNKILKEKLKPEFLARLNGAYYFKELSEEELLKTAELHLNRYTQGWNKKVQLIVNEEVYKLILSKCKEQYKDKFHARNIRDFIDMEIIQKLGDYVINSNKRLNSLEKIEIKVENDDFSFLLKRKVRRRR